jgi:hypothetical protein
MGDPSKKRGFAHRFGDACRLLVRRLRLFGRGVAERRSAKLANSLAKGREHRI